MSYDEITFDGNTVSNNLASSVVRLFTFTSSQRVPFVSVSGNIFRDNTVAFSPGGQNAVLSLASNGASSWKATGNEFANRLSAEYDITVGAYSGSSPREMMINGTSNLFSLPEELNEDLIDNRIFDDDEDSTLPEFPFRTISPT